MQILRGKGQGGEWQVGLLSVRSPARKESPVPHPESERFTIDGALIEVPASALVPRLRGRLQDGGYEGHERALLRAHLRLGDRVLDLGAGAGMVSITAARIVGAGNVTSVEANPEMLRPLKRNLRRNIGAEGSVLHMAVVADGDKRDSVDLHVSPGFWSASTLPGRAKGAAASYAVKARPLGKLIRRAQANVLAMDVEGAEQQLLATPLPEQVRLLVIELHPALYGGAARDAILADLAGQGFRDVGGGRTEEVHAMRRGD
ncbi:FkbM family methyltransferase [Paracoccus sp. Z118]|uniref:FkbM family methyltransferase n=1 Tax=Paracoccus sp. Z118 TaxID=2851017 RepID=UPI001C2CBAA9|nr:FkbM family methyltransferase [Paracoccus sp. Z118]MBV0890435.1 FkbM family methyltransferase [Paracoccus sp. Z118]